MRFILVSAMLVLGAFANNATAEVTDADKHGFSLLHEVVVSADRATAWTAAVDNIDKWWNADHTISGNSALLSIDARPLGCFCEATGGGVVHLLVTTVSPDVNLRMTGGLGPLGLMGVNGNMTWEFFDVEGGTRIRFSYAVGGYSPDGLDSIADGVDYVIGDALQLLKIYIDGESFPSHIGTGTEDYYGYAWCRPEMFDSPFHAQPCGDGNLKGGFSVNSRYRMLDAMPFRKSLQFDMELWHWESTRMNYAPATFWYARPGATCNIEPDPKSAAEPVAIRRSDVVETFAVKNAIEGEDLKILDVTGGEAQVQNVPKYRWSNDSQLWWIDAKPGDKLTLGLNVPETGDYKLTACLTKAADYGIIRLSIDGQPLGEPLDRYATEVAHDRVDLGSHRLEMGARRLEIEITGSHPKAQKRHMFGLDYLLLERDGK